MAEGKYVKEHFDLPTTKLLYRHFLNSIREIPNIENSVSADWRVIWGNLSHTFLSIHDRSKVYEFVDDIISNREKLQAYNIGNITSVNCDRCGLIDSNQHRL